MNVECWGFGSPTEVELTPGVLDANAQHAFSNGQCHALALGLNELTGWQLGGLEWEWYEPEDADVPNHVVVMSPEGEMYDVGGRGADARWNGGHYDFEPLTRETVLEELPRIGYLEPNLEAGRVFAQVVLAREEAENGNA